MDEQQWARSLRLLACHRTTLPSDCVGCWYEQHPSGEAFPGEQVSSMLCHTHRVALPMEVKQPDILGQRRYA
jgi:hypothetical protein